MWRKFPSHVEVKILDHPEKRLREIVRTLVPAVAVSPW